VTTGSESDTTVSDILNIDVRRMQMISFTLRLLYLSRKPYYLLEKKLVDYRGGLDIMTKRELVN
jgi:hypothetical protein